MKTIVAVFTISIMSYCNIVPGSGSSSGQAVFIQKGDELFMPFFETFCQDPKFQMKRVKFPIKVTSADENNTLSLMTSKDWTHTNFILICKKNPKNKYKIFEVNDSTTKMKYLVEDTGISVIHTFSKIQQEWYLTSITDESD